jgi:DNA invertase Pin-like site-specific DNA recombinase
MLIGYARTSTLEQKAGLEAQIESLRAIGCEKLYKEQTSSVAVRQTLRAAIDFSRQGDTLVVTKLDRLARSVKHLGDILEELEGKSVGLRVLDLGLDTSTATGKLMLNVLGAVAQFEREMMLERQREGIAKAKAEGRYKGRKPTARMKEAEVRSLVATGTTRKQIAQRLGISERSVYRIAANLNRLHQPSETRISM